MEDHHGSAVPHMKDTNGATGTRTVHLALPYPPPPPLATTAVTTASHNTIRPPNTNDPNTFMTAQTSVSTAAPVTSNHASIVQPPRRVSVLQGDTNGNYKDALDSAPALSNPNGMDIHNHNDALQKHTIEEQERVRKRDGNRTKDLVERAFLLGVVKAHSKRMLLKKHAQKEMAMRQAQAQAQINSYGPNIWNAQGSTAPIMHPFGGSEDEGVQMTTSEYYHHLHLQNHDRASSASSLGRRTKEDGFRHGPLDLQWEF